MTSAWDDGPRWPVTARNHGDRDASNASRNSGLDVSEGEACGESVVGARRLEPLALGGCGGERMTRR